MIFDSRVGDVGSELKDKPDGDHYPVIVGVKLLDG